jgi:hypothetical protein
VLGPSRSDSLKRRSSTDAATVDPRLGGAALGVVLLVSACSSSARSSSAQRSSISTSSTAAPEAPVAHALDIAAKIKAAGAGCVDATQDPVHGPDFSDVVTCTIGNDQVAIGRWADGTSRLREDSDARDAACYTARLKPPFGATYVEGANWSLLVAAPVNAQRIVAATGGSVRTIDCHGWTPPFGYESLLGS